MTDLLRPGERLDDLERNDVSTVKPSFTVPLFTNSPFDLLYNSNFVPSRALSFVTVVPSDLSYMITS